MAAIGESSAMGESSIFQEVARLLGSVQVELMVLVITICAHTLFFGKYTIGSRTKKNITISKAACCDTAAPGEKAAPVPTQRHRRRAESSRTALQVSPESAQQVSLIRRLGCQQRLEEARAIFEESEKSACIYNALLEACVECKDTAAAETVMEDAVAEGVADVVTYNTVIKARLLGGKTAKALRTLDTMRAAGVKPTAVTFNELLDKTIKKEPEVAWKLVGQMQQCSVRPNHITASILLKTIQPNSSSRDIDLAMSVVDALDVKMDEVLLSSVTEACIRTNRLELLAKQLEKHELAGTLELCGAHTYGSIIRAYGALNDLTNVWKAWRMMQAKDLVPTSITIGCMVEALVTNADIEGAYHLVREVRGKDATRGLVNSVIYCSLIKGFSRERKFDRVWELYEEMLADGLEPSVSSYNVVIDACARCGEMRRAPEILEEMRKRGLELNLITYCSVIKCFCQENQIDKAFELLEHMKKYTKLVPDERVFNTLLNGCARQQGLLPRSLKLLNEMIDAGVPPSNFTLSLLVKIASRAGNLEKAFKLFETLPEQFSFQPNVYVYNNLLHACMCCRDSHRAQSVHERMMREKIRPDSRTYELLANVLPNYSSAKW